MQLLHTQQFNTNTFMMLKNFLAIRFLKDNPQNSSSETSEGGCLQRETKWKIFCLGYGDGFRKQSDFRLTLNIRESLKSQ